MNPNIVTGQQIGLLGGPLYTTYKVLGAIKLARKIGGKAVYWLETNDADFNEINHIHFLDAANTLRTLTWSRDSQGYSCGLIDIDEALAALLTEFFDALRQTEFTPGLRDMALRCYVPGRTLGEASLQLARELFGQFELELFDPSTPEFKVFMRPLLLREAEHTLPGEQCHLFCLIGKQRNAIFKTDDGRGYRLRDGTPVNLTDYDLLPNVKTRPICQDAYFQTHSYVAGPGEVKYLSELGALYAAHGVRQAAVVPRMSITLLEPKVLRVLKKQNLQLPDVLHTEKAELLKQTLKSRSGFDEKALQQQAQQLTRDYLDRLKTLGLDLGKTERTMYQTLMQTIKETLGAQRAQEKTRQEQMLAAVGNLSDLLRPFGQKQERVFNLFYYMNLYGGTRLIEWLYAHYDPARETLELPATVC